MEEIDYTEKRPIVVGDLVNYIGIEEHEYFKRWGIYKVYSLTDDTITVEFPSESSFMLITEHISLFKLHDKNGVHRGHCCIHHGCKYGDEDCVVANGIQPQDYDCEECDWDEENVKSDVESIEKIIMENIYNNEGNLPDPSELMKKIKNALLGRK